MRAQGDNMSLMQQCASSTVKLSRAHKKRNLGVKKWVQPRLNLWSKCKLCNTGGRDAKVGFLSSIEEPQVMEKKYPHECI